MMSFKTGEGLPLFWHDFESLCREGRFLLLLDGFDEMDIDGLEELRQLTWRSLSDSLQPLGKW